MNGIEDKYRQLFENDVVKEPDYDAMWRKISAARKPARIKLFRGAKGLAALGIVLSIAAGSASAGYFLKSGKTEIKLVSIQELPPVPAEPQNIKEGEEYPDPSLFGKISREASEKAVSADIFEPVYLPAGYKLAFEGGQDYALARTEDGKLEKRPFIPIIKFMYNLIYTTDGSVPKQQEMGKALMVRYSYFNTSIKSSINFPSERTAAISLNGVDAFVEGDVLILYKPLKNNVLVEVRIIGPVSLDEKKKIATSILDQG